MWVVSEAAAHARVPGSIIGRCERCRTPATACGPERHLRAWTSDHHGDELNGIRVVQVVTASLYPQKLHGTIIGIPGLNIPGILHGNRNYIMSDDGGSAINLNRVMPGNQDKGDAASRFAGRVWQRLWLGNVDHVIDLHSQSRGTAYPTFVYVDPRNEGARMIADLMAPDVIKAAKPFLGNENATLRAKVGGFVELKVALLDMVQAGQIVARQTDASGDTVAEFRAPHDGKVLSVGDEPVREPGALVVRIIHWNPSDACKLGC